MSQERIESLINPKVFDEFDSLNAKLGVSLTAFEKLATEGVKVNTALGKSASVKTTVENLKQMTEVEKALAKQSQDLEKANASLNATFTERASELTKAKVVQAEVAKQMRDEARDALGLTDAYDKLTREYNAAAKEAKKLSVEFGANSREAREASARALELDQRLKSADANVGRFNKNVGNYSGALGILEKSLDKVKKQIDDYTTSGRASEGVVIQLRKEEQLLTNLVKSQVTGFATATAEIKENTKALQAMEQQGLTASSAYAKLFAATADLKDETADLKKALTNAAPDDVAFNAAADSARALIGVYGIAKSASAVFGIENEALEETLVKLQAAETALQSIEAIRAVFKKEGAVSQAIQIGLQKITIAQTNLETAAQSRSIIVRYAAIVAQKALNFVMSVSPVGILAIALGGLLLALSSFSTATKNATKDLKLLGMEMDADIKLAEEFDSAFSAASNKRIAELKANFADESQIRKATLEGIRAEYEQAAELENKYAQSAAEATATLRKETDGRIDLTEKERENLQKIEDDFEKLQDKRLSTERRYETTRLGFLKEVNEEIADVERASVDEQITTANVRLDLLNRISGDEKKSYDVRIKAVKDFSAVQKSIIELQKRQVLEDPRSSNLQKIAAERNASAEIIKLRRETADKIAVLLEEQVTRERKAQLEILQIRLEDGIKTNELIIENEKSTHEQVLDAQYDNYTKRRDILTLQHREELENQKFTNTEKIALERKYASEVSALTIEYGKEVAEFQKNNSQSSITDSETRLSKRLAEIQNETNNELNALADRYQQGLIKEEVYQEQRADIERKATIDTLIEEAAAAKRKIQNTQAGTQARYDAEKELYDKIRALRDADLNDFEQDLQTRLAIIDRDYAQINKVYSTGTKLASDLIQALGDREKNRIQESIEANDEKTKREIDAVAASTLSEQEKADKITIINARSQAQKEQLERKQRQIDLQRARFEKAASIGQIIINTAQAVTKQLAATPLPAGLPLVLGVGALGAAELAIAIAQPLPKFATGTLDAPGGPAIVGDGGKSELVVEPSGRMRITKNVSEVMNIPKHSIVLPDAMEALKGGLHPKWGGSVMAREDRGYHQLGLKIDRLNSTIKNKQEIHVYKTKDGWRQMKKNGGTWTEYLNKNL